MPSTQLIITAKDVNTGAIQPSRPQYDEQTGKIREARVFITFDGANNLTAAPHALGRVPTGFSVVAIGKSGGSPGVVYTDDLPLAFSLYNVALKCTTSKTWADIKVF